jgi:hypothetical protein
MPNQVRIALVKEAASDASDIVHNIAMDTPNDGSYVWPVPMVAFPNGRYKIAVRAKGTSVIGISPAFNIRMKAGPLEAKLTPPKPPTDAIKIEPKVTITRPKSSSRWNFGESQDILIETNFDVYNFQMDLTSRGNVVYPIHSGPIDPYTKEGLTRKYRKRWHIGIPPGGDGTYRVRVKARYKAEEYESFSDGIYLSGDAEMKTTRISMSPEKIMNASDVEQGEINYDDLAWVGWNSSRYYRSQIIFPLSRLQNKNIVLLIAQLRLTVHSHQNSTGCQNSAARKLHVFYSPWKGEDFPIPAYFYKDIPETSRPVIASIDVRQQVISWISGQEPNHGFLLTTLEPLLKCFSKYNPTLFLHYREPK